MSWIAVSEPEGAWTCPERMRSADPSALLPRGTLMLEAVLSGGDRPQRLLSLEREIPWPGSLSLTWVPGEGLALVVAQCGRLFQTVLSPPVERREGPLRITFSWNSPVWWARLAVERVDGTVLALKETADAPPPLLMTDARALAQGGMACAVSDEVEPLGPVPSLAPDTPIDTPQGPRPVADLRCGDRVRTLSGHVMPVLARLERSVPVLGAFRPVRLKAPNFGLARDVTVSRTQALVVGGADVAYLFGCDKVLIPAQALITGGAETHEDIPRPVVTWHQLLMPRPEELNVAGAGIESLHIGRLRRNRDLLRHTLLKDVSAGLLPEHGGRALKVLQPFEAVALARSRAA